MTAWLGASIKVVATEIISMYDACTMSSTADPQQVFRSPLPVGTSLVVVFVPSKDRDGNPIDQEKWVDEVLTTLGQVFRGATA